MSPGRHAFKTTENFTFFFLSALLSGVWTIFNINSLKSKLTILSLCRYKDRSFRLFLLKVFNRVSQRSSSPSERFITGLNMDGPVSYSFSADVNRRVIVVCYLLVLKDYGSMFRFSF